MRAVDVSIAGQVFMARKGQSHVDADTVLVPPPLPPPHRNMYTHTHTHTRARAAPTHTNPHHGRAAYLLRVDHVYNATKSKRDAASFLF